MQSMSARYIKFGCIGYFGGNVSAEKISTKINETNLIFF